MGILKGSIKMRQFDEQKWNSLDHSRLAFKVNPETNEVLTGLFEE